MSLRNELEAFYSARVQPVPEIQETLSGRRPPTPESAFVATSVVMKILVDMIYVLADECAARRKVMTARTSRRVRSCCPCAVRKVRTAGISSFAAGIEFAPHRLITRRLCAGRAAAGRVSRFDWRNGVESPYDQPHRKDP
jgi:hypothetical protein